MDSAAIPAGTIFTGRARLRDPDATVCRKGEWQMTNPRNVAILVFHDVEVLDFAGPYEVFSNAGAATTPPPFHVYTVGITEKPVSAKGNLVVEPRYAIDKAPQADVLVIPGGFGTRPLLKNDLLIAWIREQSERVELLLSVCTGALLLARAGILSNCSATTHHGAFDHLENLSPTTRIVRDRRFVQSKENVYTSGGISAGIDLSLHIVQKLAGPAASAAVVEEMEYKWFLNERETE
jgi:transcriptional regulator GlxA family with amidase domain